MKSSCRYAIRSVIALTVTCLMAIPLSAQETAPVPGTDATLAESAPAVSPEAQGVLDRMTTYMQGLQNFSIESRSTRDEVLPYGYKLQNNEKASLVVQRPNKLRSEVSGDLRTRTFLYDGTKLVIYSPDDKAYARIDAPDTIAKLISGILDAGIELPLIDVLYQSAAGTLTDQVRNGILVGDSVVEGVECDHLAFRQAGTDWQLWVAKGAQPLPRKIVITTRYEVGSPQFEAIMNWNLKPKIGASTFAFAAPKGAVEIPFDQPAAIAGDAQ